MPTATHPHRWAKQASVSAHARSRAAISRSVLDLAEPFELGVDRDQLHRTQGRCQRRPGRVGEGRRLGSDTPHALEQARQVLLDRPLGAHDLPLRVAVDGRLLGVARISEEVGAVPADEQRPGVAAAVRLHRLQHEAGEPARGRGPADQERVEVELLEDLPGSSQSCRAESAGALLARLRDVGVLLVVRGGEVVRSIAHAVRAAGHEVVEVTLRRRQPPRWRRCAARRSARAGCPDSGRSGSRPVHRGGPPRCPPPRAVATTRYSPSD